MKEKSRLVSILLVATLMINSLFAFPIKTDAKEVQKATIYTNEDFETFASTPPSGWVVYGEQDSAKVIGKEISEGMGISARLSINDLGNHNLNLNHTLAYPIKGEAVFEAKIMADKNSLFAPIFQIENSIGKRTALASLNGDGWIKAGGKKIQEYELGQWYTLSCIVDLDQGIMDVYIDGEKKAEQIPYSDDVKDVSIFKFYIKGQEDKEVELYLDDVRVYSGNELIEDDSFFEKSDEEEPVEDSLTYAKMKERMKNAKGLYIDSPYAYVNNNKVLIGSTNSKISPFLRDETIFIPLKWLVNNIDMEYIQNQEDNSIIIGKGEEVYLEIKDPKGKTVKKDMTLTGNPIKIDLKTGTVIRNTRSLSYKRDIIQKDNNVYVSGRFAEEILEQEIFWDDRGLIVISGEKQIFNPVEDEDLINEVIKEIIFERPTATQIIKDLKEKNPNNQHPRLFLTPDTIDTLKVTIKNDDYAKSWYKSLRRQANKVLDAPVGKYELPDGRRMQSAKDAKPYIEETALMYLLSGEEQYLTRAIAELEAVIKFPDWNHQNEFLNTATMTAAVAIGYDWLYDELSEELRTDIRKAITEKGLKKALDAHENRAWWSQPRELVSNWNAVSNGGIIVGALAIGDEETDIAGEIIAKSMRSFEDVMLMEFSPDGGWDEGPGYWRYTIEYVVNIMASMNSALDTTYGYGETPGLKETAYFPLYMTGPQGSFNFADASSNKMKMPELFWLAKELNDPDIAGLRLALMDEAKQAGSVYDLIWYNPDFYNKDVDLALDKYFRGPEVVALRNQWNNVYGQFAGFKGGKGYVSHGHLDIGNFVYHANGEQWAIDLGPDNYTSTYFNYHTDRFHFYRNKPEGHNTIVINPDGTYQQDHLSHNKIEKVVSKPKGSFAILDMEGAYAKNAKAAKRGVMLGQDRSMMLVQDEVTTLKPSEIWWFMHTKADIEIHEGRQSATLTQNGQKLWAQIITPDGSGEAKFSVMDPVPLVEEELVPPGQKEIVGIQKLTIELEEVTQMNMAVALIPLQYQEEKPASIPSYIPLAQWDIPEGEIEVPVVKEITLDGQLIEGFKSNTYNYDIKLPFGSRKVPTIDSTSDYELEIIQPTSLLDVGQVIVSSKDNPDEVTKYTIRFSILPSNKKPENVSKIDIGSVDASDFQNLPNNFNPPEHSIDGDLDTRWSSEGEQWIEYELESMKKVSSLGIAFHNGHIRSSIFDIELSKDGEVWEKVYIGASSGTTSAVEYFGFIEQEAKYVRINGNGNSVNGWNSYTEVEVYGVE